jgi:hypothetical protein
VQIARTVTAGHNATGLCIRTHTTSTCSKPRNTLVVVNIIGIYVQVVLVFVYIYIYIYILAPIYIYIVGGCESESH